MENLLNIFFPPKCLFCKAVGAVICKECLSRCNILNKEFVLYTHKPIRVYSPFEYEGIVRKCIRYSKYSAKQFSALKLLTKKGVDLLPNNYRSNFIIVPIPLSKARNKSRGFNQAEIIANILSHKINLPVENSILIRKKETVPQYGLGKKERKINIQGAFAVPETVSDLNILLTDDVCTSGTTFIEAAKTLYGAGARKVECFALSKKL